MKLVIEGELTNLNDYIKAERSNRFWASKIKKEETERVAWECKAQRIDLLSEPRFFIFHWYLKDTKVDPDNIAFAKKFVLDGLYLAGVIVNDNQKYVKGFADLISVDPLRPRLCLATIAHLPKELRCL